ncbi:MAG: response regulator [Chloroflexi bacterium]|nr:response regulator [Chloroflexota bacterium]
MPWQSQGTETRCHPGRFGHAGHRRGLQLIPLLRKSMPDLGIVALTVHDNDQYREAAMDAGADAFITKSRILQNLEPTIKEVKSAQAPKPTDTPKAEFTGSRSMRILVMDDDPGLLTIYSKALSHKSYEVDLAATMDAARAHIDEYVYGVFICDIHMGDERGTDLLAELGGYLKSQGTEIIMASAYGQYRFMTESYGSEYFLEKPVSIHTLVTLIERVLEGTSPAEQPAHTPTEAAAT